MGETIAQNRRARHEFAIEETFEAGLVLRGTEIKSVREHHVSLAEAYARVERNEAWIVGLHIAPWGTTDLRFNHEPKRMRKLLVRKSEANKLTIAVQREGLTLIPLKLYFTPRGIAKIELGIAKGKKLHDKRETEKRRDWARDKARIMRAKG